MIIKVICILLILFGAGLIMVGSFNSLRSYVTAKKTEGTVVAIDRNIPKDMVATGKITLAIKDASNPEAQPFMKTFSVMQFTPDIAVGNTVKVWYWGKELANVEWKNFGINNESYFWGNLFKIALAGCGFIAAGTLGSFIFSLNK